MIDLYKNIKELRIESGMSQEELAHKVGYADKGMISRIENGKVDLPQSKIVEFANVFGVTPVELMGWEDIKNTSADGRLLTDEERIRRTAKDDPLSPEERDFIVNYHNAPVEVQQAIRALLKFSK